MSKNMVRRIGTLFIIGLAIIALIAGALCVRLAYVGFTAGMFECFIGSVACFGLMTVSLAIIYGILLNL